MFHKHIPEQSWSSADIKREKLKAVPPKTDDKDIDNLCALRVCAHVVICVCACVCVCERERERERCFDPGQVTWLLGTSAYPSCINTSPLYPGRQAVGRQRVSSLASAHHTLTGCLCDYGGGVVEKDLHPSPQLRSTEFKLFLSPPLATMPWVNKQLGSGAKQSAPLGSS